MTEQPLLLWIVLIMIATVVASGLLAKVVVDGD